MMSGEVPAYIKHNVKAVLSSKVGGIPMSEFLSDYYNRHFEPLKFRDLGFSSLQDFITSIPDVARMMTTKGSDIKIFGVGEPDSYLPVSPRSVQDHRTKDYTKTAQVEKLNGIPQTSTDDDDMEPDFAGLWSVCFPLKLCPTRDSKELVAMFSQAGEVKRTMFAKYSVFVRYASKEEALLAEELFCDLQVHIAQKHYKDKRNKVSQHTKHSQNMNGICDRRTSVEAFEVLQNSGGKKNKLHPVMNDSVNGRHARVENDPSLMEKIFNAYEQHNGYHSGQEIQNGLFSANCPQLKLPNRENRSYAASVETDSIGSGKTSLYVGNIESVDDFREMIKPYDPVTVTVNMRQGKIIAFVNMSSEKSARQAIADLNKKCQKTRCLIVDFAKSHDKSDNDSLSGESSSDTHSVGRSKVKGAYRSPCVEPDFTDMPPLVNLSTFGPDADIYHLDCSIYVASFPVNCVESVLRNAFAMYHVLDVYMVNNGNEPGCTKAFLYLASVYDVIQAVVEMDGSCVFGRPLKVDVPYGNTVLRAVVDKKLAKYRPS